MLLLGIGGYNCKVIPPKPPRPVPKHISRTDTPKVAPRAYFFFFLNKIPPRAPPLFHTSSIHATTPLRTPLLPGKKGLGSSTSRKPRDPRTGLGTQEWRREGGGLRVRRDGRDLGRTGQGAWGGRRGIAGFPRGGASQAARGAHHRCWGRKPAGARGRAGGLRSRSSRGGLGRGPGSGGGAEGAPGAALGFWLRTMKGAPMSRGGKARVALGRTLPGAGRRGAAAAARAPPFRTVGPPPAAPAHAHASRARGRRRPVPVTHPLAGPPPREPGARKRLAHAGSLLARRVPAHDGHAVLTQDSTRWRRWRRSHRPA